MSNKACSYYKVLKTKKPMKYFFLKRCKEITKGNKVSFFMLLTRFVKMFDQHWLNWIFKAVLLNRYTATNKFAAKSQNVKKSHIFIILVSSDTKVSPRTCFQYKCDSSSKRLRTTDFRGPWEHFLNSHKDDDTIDNAFLSIKLDRSY